jgi:Mrp family chromosome partitioning ATPase
VLLIHADLHKRLPPGTYAGCEQPAYDLVDLLTEPEVEAHEALLRDDRSGYDALFARELPPDALRLLGSPNMARLVHDARLCYDAVVIDTPPVLGLSDYGVVAGMADQVLFVVRWKLTARRAVQASLREIRATGLPLSGLVLNQIRLGTYRRFAGGEYLSYYDTTARYYPERAA